MKIYQLIQALEEYPQNTDVVLLDLNDDSGNTLEIKSVEIVKGENKEEELKFATIQF